MTKNKLVRVRIAPSPTGYFHIGTARTALYNFLFAKKNKGKFILRVEDTDLQRSDIKYEKDIIHSLKWLGLQWDEGPFRQSRRTKIYEKHLQKLAAENKIYHCFCSKEQLEQKKQKQLAQSITPHYDGACRDLSPETVAKKLAQNEPSILRLKVAAEKITFTDLIRGPITFETQLIGDIAIAKNQKTPLYNFAVVIDDETMKISHVIRGEDHIANTPKQILIQKALNFNQPVYAHLPLILDPNRQKMSKRYAAASIKEYQEQDYLSEAILNFLLLLGWHPSAQQGMEKEIFSIKEAVKAFDLNRVQKSGAVFNLQKLNWLNAQYLKQLPEKDLAKRLKIKPTAKNIQIIKITKERMEKISDFKPLSHFFYQLPDYPASLLIWKKSAKEKTQTTLQALIKLDNALNPKKIGQLAAKEGTGDVFWPLRVALSGQQASPGPLEIMAILGKRETLKRLKIAARKLNQ